MFKGNKAVGLTDTMGDLRRFEWMLSPEQSKQLNQWIQSGIKHQRHLASAGMPQATQEENGDNKDEATGSLNVSSSAASNPVVPFKKQQSFCRWFFFIF